MTQDMSGKTVLSGKTARSFLQLRTKGLTWFAERIKLIFHGYKLVETDKVVSFFCEISLSNHTLYEKLICDKTLQKRTVNTIKNKVDAEKSTLPSVKQVPSGDPVVIAKNEKKINELDEELAILKQELENVQSENFKLENRIQTTAHMVESIVVDSPLDDVVSEDDSPDLLKDKFNKVYSQLTSNDEIEKEKLNKCLQEMSGKIDNYLLLPGFKLDNYSTHFINSIKSEELEVQSRIAGPNILRGLREQCINGFLASIDAQPKDSGKNNLKKAFNILYYCRNRKTPIDLLTS